MNKVEVILKDGSFSEIPHFLDAIVEEDAVALSEIGSHVRSQDFSSNAEIIVSNVELIATIFNFRMQLHL
jgi:hypothetical protein